MTALGLVLANIHANGSQPISQKIRNQKTIPRVYNPSGVGSKPLAAVLRVLADAGYLDLHKGIPQFRKDKNFVPIRARSSFFTAKPFFVDQIRKSISSEYLFVSPPFYIAYKNRDDDLLDFEWDDFTNSVNEQMREYCEFMQRQSLMIGDEPLSYFEVVRTFRDWGSDGSFLYGGRGWHPFMGMEKRLRSQIKINGSKTVALDYPASEPNILYLMMTGKRLSPDEDPYSVDGLERKEVKSFFTIMLNTRSIQGAVKALENYLSNKRVSDEDKSPIISAEKKLGTKEKVIHAILDRNKPIAPCLLQGKAMGQHYQWLEANLVFHVAHQLCLRGIPGLTVHDEFVVREQDKQVAEHLMYSEWPEDLPVLDKAPWNSA